MTPSSSSEVLQYLGQAAEHRADLQQEGAYAFDGLLLESMASSRVCGGGNGGGAGPSTASAARISAVGLGWLRRLRATTRGLVLSQDGNILHAFQAGRTHVNAQVERRESLPENMLDVSVARRAWNGLSLDVTKFHCADVSFTS